MVYPIEPGSWLNDKTLSFHDNLLNGFSVQRYQVSGPGPGKKFSFDQPVELLRFRSKRKVGENEYENDEGPSDGLLIWVRKFESESSSQ